MRKATVFALKHLLLGLGFLLTFSAFVLIAIAFLYLSLGVNKQVLEKYLSEQIQRPVQIESIETGWDGLQAEMRAQGIQVRHADGTQSTLRLRELQVSVDPLYLFGGSFRVTRTVVYGLTLEVTRHTDGTIRIGDLAFVDKDVSDSDPLDWLLRQGETEIREGKIVWRDQRDADHSFAVTEFNVETRSHDKQIRFTGRASPPTELGNQIYFNGEVRGMPFRDELWDGDINVSLSRLNVDQLPLVVQEFSPWQTKGLVDLSLKTRWQNGQMTYANADLELSRFVVPLGKGHKGVPLQKFNSAITWRGSSDAWSLSFQNPRLAVNGRWFRTKHFKVDFAQNSNTYVAEGVQIYEILGVLNQMQLEFPWQDLIHKSRAHGVLQNVSLVTTGPFFAPDDWSLDSEFVDVAWGPFGNTPGVTGVNGSVHIEPGKGWVKFDSDDVEINSPSTFEQPLPLDQLEASIEWEKSDTDLKVNVGDLRLGNSDLRRGRGDFNLRIFQDGSRPPYIKGEFAADELRAESFWQYLPKGSIPQKTIDWFRKALVQGVFTGLDVSLEGNVHRFPFRAGEGSFSIKTKVRNGRFHYKDRWPELDEIMGTLTINDAGLRGEVASAKFNNSRVKHGLITSDDIFSKNKELSISAGLSSPLEDIVKFLTEGPLVEQKKSLKIAAAGEGELDLNIFLPLSDIKNRLEVAGRYVAQDAALTIQDHFVLKQLSGAIEFTDKTVESAGISGTLMGGETSIDIETIEPGRPPTWIARAHGRVDSAQLVPLLGSRVVADNVNGTASWTGALRAKPGQTTLQIESDLNGIEIALPEPLSKQREDERRGELTATFEGGRQNLSFRVDPLIGQLDYRRQKNKLKLNRGIIAVGKDRASLPPNQGLSVEIWQPSFDVDRWLAVLGASDTEADTRRTTMWSALNEVDLNIGKLRFLARDWAGVHAKASSSNGLDWNAWISGDALLGEGALRFSLDDQPNRYALNFNYLHWPRREQAQAGRGSPAQPSQYPDLNVRADKFKYGNWDLGKLELAAVRDGSRWRIKKLNLDQPGLKVEADGHWAKGASGPKTRIRADVHSDDVAIALAQLQLPPHIAESDVRLLLDLNWPDNPAGFRLDNLYGDFDITATEGRFLNVEPGSGRLLGLFNVDAISRRFSLDFSDIFSKGLTFDQIKGKGRISAGELYTEGLFVIGPSAVVEIGGRTGLASEDYDLEVIVVPQLGSHISMLSALANPIAGAMVFIAQKVMKKTFNKLLTEMAHYRYRIEGSWEEPVITSVLMEPVSEEESMR